MHIEAFCALRATSHLPNIPQEGPVDPDQIGCIDLVRLAAPTSLAPVLFSFLARESHLVEHASHLAGMGPQDLSAAKGRPSVCGSGLWASMTC